MMCRFGSQVRELRREAAARNGTITWLEGQVQTAQEVLPPAPLLALLLLLCACFGMVPEYSLCSFEAQR